VATRHAPFPLLKNLRELCVLRVKPPRAKHNQQPRDNHPHGLPPITVLKSNVTGNGSVPTLGPGIATSIVPPVKPSVRNRLARRASASNAFTGKLS
jgi:hypothetical protein